MTEYKIDYWDCRYLDRYTHKTVDDAIVASLRALRADGKPLPVFLYVHGVSREIIDEQLIATWAKAVLAVLMRDLDDEFGDPNVIARPPAGAQDAALSFVRHVVAGFEVCRFQKVATKAINVRDWCQEHHPEWLDEVRDARVIDDLTRPRGHDLRRFFPR